MNIKQQNTTMVTVIWMAVLAAILLTAVGGILIQRTGLTGMVGDMGIARGNNLLQPQSTQTSPTGELALNMGINLLMAGFVVGVLTWVVRRKR